VKTMAEVLNEHSDWAWSGEQGEVLCIGCDWSKKLTMIDPAAVHFRAHQADALAAEGYGPVRDAGAAGIRSVCDIWGSEGRSIVRMGELMNADQKVLSGEWDDHIKWNMGDIRKERERRARAEALEAAR
jgi:hypothetical protein